MPTAESMHTLVVLDAQECYVAQQIGKFRAKLRRGDRDPYFGKLPGKLDPIESHTEGMASELAVARVLNVAPRLGDLRVGDADMRHDGMEIEVKRVRYVDAPLRVNVERIDEADVFVLVSGSLPEFRIVGCVSRRRLKAHGRVATVPSGEVFEMAQAELSPIEMLRGVAE
jgi:hypothetical protein